MARRSELAQAVFDFAHQSWLTPAHIAEGPPDTLLIMRAACVEAGIVRGQAGECVRTVPACDLRQSQIVIDTNTEDLLKACIDARATWDDFSEDAEYTPPPDAD